MNVNEIKELITALAPAGQAVHQTAGIYLGVQVLDILIGPISIFGLALLGCHYSIKHRTMANEQTVKKAIERLDGRLTIDEASLTALQANEIRKAIEEYAYKNSEVVNMQFSRGHQYRRIKQSAIDELVKFLREVKDETK